MNETDNEQIRDKNKRQLQDGVQSKNEMVKGVDLERRRVKNHVHEMHLSVFACWWWEGKAEQSGFIGLVY